MTNVVHKMVINYSFGKRIIEYASLFAYQLAHCLIAMFFEACEKIINT